MSIEHDCAQYSDEWYEMKIGKPSASGFHNIITPTGVPTRGDKRMKYMYRLIAERLIHQSMDDRYQSYWMKRGKEVEEEAAAAFTQKIGMGRGWYMDRIGLVTTDDEKIVASPDRVLRHSQRSVRANVEIKCPSPWVQVEYLLSDKPEGNYTPQVQGQLYVTGYQAAHFFSFHPLMPSVHWIIERDDDYISKLAKELYFFCNELDVETDRARRMGPFKLAELVRLSAEMADQEQTLQ